MKRTACLCDACAEDGFPTLANAKYEDSCGAQRHACSAHLKQVEGVGCEILERYETPGNVALPNDHGDWKS